MVGRTPTNLSFDLFPVARAVAAGAESVMADSAEYVRMPPDSISSMARLSPLYHLERVVAPVLVPSITIMMTLVGSFFLSLAWTSSFIVEIPSDDMATAPAKVIPATFLLIFPKMHTSKNMITFRINVVY